jgi:putative ABC transport system permease protein
VRLALGADPPGVVRLVMREGAALVWLGVLVGAPGIYVSGRLVGRLPLDVPGFDPPTLASVTLGIVAIGIGTCYVAARPVLSIEPARLLRQE